LALGPIEVDSQGVGFRLQLTSQPRVASTPIAETGPSALPPLKPNFEPVEGLSLSVPVSLSWEEATRQALAKLPEDRGLRLPQGGHLTIEGLQAKTDADRVLLKVKARVEPPWGGSLPAVLWVAARPVWDSASGHLKLVDAELEVQTQDLVAQAASWLLQKSWIKDLEKTWDWDLGPEITAAKTRVAAALVRQKLADHLQLEVSLTAMSVEALRLSSTGPLALVRIEGSGTVAWIP
jgi:hypothetical protein